MKVKHLQGEVPDATSAVGKAGPAMGFSVDFGPSGRNPAQQISESLRNALVNPSESRQGSATPTPGAVAASSGVSVTKSEVLFQITLPYAKFFFSERRINTPASIKITPVPSPTKLRSASPSAAVIPQTTHARSRLRQVVPVEESEPEAGGDDEMDVDDDAEDERLYCFCQKQSYGDVSECSLFLTGRIIDQVDRWWLVIMKMDVPTNGFVSLCLRIELYLMLVLSSILAALV
jgi:chromatin modification-related protein YNG2